MLSIGQGFQFDYVFDWTILKYQQAQMTTAPPRAIVCTRIKLTLLP
jgi:casein kinase 1